MRHSATILREVWCSGLVVTTSSRSASTSRINSKIVTSRRRRRSNSARRWRGISRPSPVRKTARSRSHERRGGPFPNALGEQQCFNSVLDAKLLLHQVLALAVYALGILVFRRRHAYHSSCLKTAHNTNRGVEPASNTGAQRRDESEPQSLTAAAPAQHLS